MNQPYKSFFLSIALVTVAACGGGGGGGGGDDGGPGSSSATVDPALAITQLNAEEVSAVTVGGTSAATQAGGSTIVFSASIDAPESDFEISQLIRSMLKRVPEEALVDTDLATGIRIAPTTVSCADPDIGGVSGSVQVSGDVASLLAYSADDELNFDFFSCELQPGFVLDGGMDLVILAVSGNQDFVTPPYRLATDADFDDFTVLDGLAVYFADGDMVIDQSHTLADIESIEVMGEVLRVREGASSTVRLFDFSGQEIIDYNTNTYTLEQTGMLDSVILGGSVSFFTLATFEGVLGESPNAGTLLMVGAGDSAARLEVIDEFDVNIFVDEEGDGTFVAPIVVPWDDLVL